MNVLLDTGASSSLIELGSLEKLGLQENIQQPEYHLIDASGHNMNIIGSVCVKISVKYTIVYQNMKVPNSKSYKNVLLG